MSNRTNEMIKKIALLINLCLFCLVAIAQDKRSFNNDWEFVKDVDTVFSAQLLDRNTKTGWVKVSLPHTANIEPIEKVAQQWQGICFYRKFFSVPMASKDKHVALQFDAAMIEADVYLNGKHIYNHKGGYLPFYIDISNAVKFGEENSVVVKLNNKDNTEIPPGRLLKNLDFNYYSGLYRDSWVIVKDNVHITNAISANRKNAGGILLHYDNVTKQSARLTVQTDIQNDFTSLQEIEVKVQLADKQGKIVAKSSSGNQQVEKQNFKLISQIVTISNPHLWSVDDPYLYQLTVEVLRKGKVIDREEIKTGIRTIRFEPGAFYLNDEKVNIVGTNRHQEYPLIGYALSNNAQYRDAYKIKEAGFNFVRSSHYPQSPAFLDACDELGILVMNSIPGWQYFGREAFQQLSIQNTKDMVRRDRNHVSIILWEASLNETNMTEDYMKKTHETVHEELPYENIYTCGWVDKIYDVFIPARQHAKTKDYWKNYKKEKPLLIAEYGDWEYYAQNAGFNQKEFKDLKQEEKTSRQLRGFGQKRLLQQALNYQESHNDNLYGPAVGDANWLIFDYKRGYADDIESSGIMDIVRLPKFAFYFYQSQVDVKPNVMFAKPMVYIANYWQNPSDTTILVYSNCDEVELFINGRSVGRQKPIRDNVSTTLKHPPFTFKINKFEPGLLTAIGYQQNKETAKHSVQTPGKPTGIILRPDLGGKNFAASQNDIVFVYAEIVDEHGAVVHDSMLEIDFKIEGDAEIVASPKVKAEAGIATILVRAGVKPGTIKIQATSTGLKLGELMLKSK